MYLSSEVSVHPSELDMRKKADHALPFRSGKYKMAIERALHEVASPLLGLTI